MYINCRWDRCGYVHFPVAALCFLLALSKYLADVAFFTHSVELYAYCTFMNLYHMVLDLTHSKDI